jgi:phosphopantetheinyl transferase
MPLIRKTEIGDGFLALWELEESAEELLGEIVLSPEEHDFYSRITAEHRRREWLAWHVMIRRLIGPGALTGYNAVGAPILKNTSAEHPLHLSVSHSGPWVALYVRRRRCGLDIESLDRQYARVASRYISPAERALWDGEADSRFHALMWSTKEAVYKYAGVRGLGFLEQIRVVAIDKAHALISVSLSDASPFPLRYEFWEGYCMVYTV